MIAADSNGGESAKATDQTLSGAIDQDWRVSQFISGEPMEILRAVYHRARLAGWAAIAGRRCALQLISLGERRLV